jgi:hypothetical protein
MSCTSIASGCKLAFYLGWQFFTEHLPLMIQVAVHSRCLPCVTSGTLTSAAKTNVNLINKE